MSSFETLNLKNNSPEMDKAKIKESREEFMNRHEEWVLKARAAIESIGAGLTMGAAHYVLREYLGEDWDRYLNPGGGFGGGAAVYYMVRSKGLLDKLKEFKNPGQK